MYYCLFMVSLTVLLSTHGKSYCTTVRSWGVHLYYCLLMGNLIVLLSTHEGGPTVLLPVHVESCCTTACSC